MSTKTLLAIIFSLFFLFLGIGVFGSIGFLSASHYGKILGLSVGCVFFLISALMGDKILLALIEAFPLDSKSELTSIIKNFSCHLKIDKISLFHSVKYGNNIYLFDSYWGPPSLIIGDEVMKGLSKSELKAILYEALITVRKGEGKLRNLINVALAPFYLPLLLIPHKNESERRKFWRCLVNFYFFPIASLKSYLFKIKRNSWHQRAHRQKDLLSALFKIGQLNASGRGGLIGTIMNDLAITENETSELMFQLIKKTESSQF